MSELTKYFNLFKYDTKYDGKLPFDIDKALNKNWDIVDEALKDAETKGGHSVFDVVAKDHILTFKESKGLVLLGNYVYKYGSPGTRYGYTDFYNTCLKEYNEGTAYERRGARRFVTTGTTVIHGNEYQDREVIASNFSTANGVIGNYSNLNDNSYSTKTTIKFTTGTDVATTQYFISGGRYNFIAGITKSKMVYYVSTNGTAWNVISGKTGTTTIAANTTYTLELEIDNLGNVTSKVNGQQDYTFTSTLTTSTQTRVPLYFGIYPDSEVQVGEETSDEEEVTGTFSGVFLGTIDLNSINIQINYNNSRQENIKLYQQIQCRKNANGHVFYDIKEKSKVDALYNWTGMAWLYGVDTENERIFLPRNDWYYQNGLAKEIGNLKIQGLPEIYGRFTTPSFSGGNTITNCFGAFDGERTPTYKGGNYSGTGDSHTRGGTNFYASKSNSIYGNSLNVQPNSVKVLYYMVVGNTEEIASKIEVIDVTTSENDTIPLGANDYFLTPPDNISWLKASEQWYDGNMYSTFYNWLVSNKNKDYIKTDETSATLYDYILDENNILFKLPQLNGKENLIGDIKENIVFTNLKTTLVKDGVVTIEHEQAGSTPFVRLTNLNTGQSNTGSADAGTTTNTYKVSASVFGKRGDIITYDRVGNLNNCIFTTTFTPMTARGDLYFKVGNAVQNQELINVGQLTEVVNNKINVNSKYVDGQWVSKFQLLSQAKAIDTYTIDLSTYLPNDGYDYEVIFSCYFASSNSGSSRISLRTDIIKGFVNSDFAPFLINSNGRYQGAYMNLPVGPARYCTLQISDTATSASDNKLVALGYRRLGINK